MLNINGDYMVNDIIIESVIASIDLKQEMDLIAINDLLENSTLESIIDEKTEEETPLNLIYETNNNIFLTLFYTGKLVSSKATTVKDAEESINDFIDFLTENNFL